MTKKQEARDKLIKESGLSLEDDDSDEMPEDLQDKLKILKKEMDNKRKEGSKKLKQKI